MLKRHDSAYVPGRPKGPWFKWKRDPFHSGCGGGLCTAWPRQTLKLLFGLHFRGLDRPRRRPHARTVGKAYFGFTDEELKLLDKFVRENTIERLARCVPFARNRIMDWSWRSPLKGSPLNPTQIRCRNALSPLLATAPGTSRPRSGPA
ncbi:hypothetical protein Ddc_24662 [Ditylenchus destructor]|nr:hypothetical protein Ddc_24662 [Ditylenchus destructor]